MASEFNRVAVAPEAFNQTKVKEEWEKFTWAGKFFGPLLVFTLFSSLWVAALSFRAIGQVGDRRAPLHLNLMLGTSVAHICFLTVCVGIIAGLKKSVKAETLDRIDAQLGSAFLLIMICFWCSAVIVAFAAEPTCDLDSSWSNTLAALRRTGPTNTTIQRCRASLLGLGFSTLNAVILLGACVTALFVPFSRTEAQPLVWPESAFPSAAARRLQ